MNEHMIGVDPGDRWTGVARLYIRNDYITLATHVIDATNLMLSEVVDYVFLGSIPKHVVAEEYRARPTGFNRFRAARTPRLLGALEYNAHFVFATWATIPAAPFNSIQSFPIWTRLKQWKEHWPDSKSHRWDHALSAWRVLSAYVLRNKPLINHAIERSRRSAVEYDVAPDIPETLVAPFISWKLLTPHENLRAQKD